jgi:succinate-semialdehyde dehydrogenase / glutarate-semialdehyde dehydrogenase
MASAPPLRDADLRTDASDVDARSCPGPGLGVSAICPALPDEVHARLVARVVTTGRRQRHTVISPLAQEPLGTVPSCTAADVSEAVRRGRSAQASWAARSHADRARVLRRLGDLVLERQDEVLDLIQLESGKVRAHAFEEVADVAMVANYYARNARKHLASRRREGALPVLTSTREVRHPKGVVGFIAPWNYPLSMAITDVIPALAAGNACVVKPAEQTPFTALWIVDLAIEAGVPADLLTVVTGRGATLGTPIIEQVDFVTFTGSTATGRTVARQAGEQLIGCALELGGKNAMVVLEDADLDRAVDGAVRGGFASAGQLCISIERLLVHAAIADAFTERLVSRINGLVLSTALVWGGEMGSLASEQQFQTVRDHVEDAVAKGARVLTGGEPRPAAGPLVYAPTLLTDVTPDMDVHADETFGPVVSLSTFEDDEEAVATVNASRYGLNASVWTRDVARGERLAARLQAGTVNVNDAYAAAWASIDAPMGGFKDSGLGRRHGREGIWKYTEVQTIATQALLPVGSLPMLSDEHTAAVLSPAVRLLGRLPDLPHLPRVPGLPRLADLPGRRRRS